MPRSVSFAAIQLNAAPGATAERLARAEAIISQAASAGAQIIVLPEVFNTGYTYSDENFLRAEDREGPTVSWMKRMAARLGIHLAGTLLLREEGEIYNTLFLVAPGGRSWSYHKRYPWAWERAYFHPGCGITVAETSLGAFGLMICWDVAHPDLWAAYAGKVQAMIVSSCPPQMFRPTLRLPNGISFDATQPSARFRGIMRHTEHTFGTFVRRQSAWLGVPVVNATPIGKFSSRVPRPLLTLLPYLPLRALRWWRQLSDARLEAAYFQEAYLADAAGQPLATGNLETEGFILAMVSLPDSPQPHGTQPPFGLGRATYLADKLVNQLMTPVYRQGIRKTVL